MTPVFAALATPRLTLAPIGAHDIDDVWRMLVQAEVRRFLCDDKILPRAFVAGLVDEDIALASDGLGLRIVRDKAGFCGFAGIKPVSAEIAACIPAFRDNVEISIALDPSRWGRGYAREALAAVMAEYDAQATGRRLVAVADVPNLRSRTLLERLGFVLSGEHAGPLYRLAGYRRAADRIATS